MRIPAQVSIPQIERLLVEVQSSLGATDLTIPAGVRAKGIGADVALIQLILTWANRFQSRRLNIPVQADPGDFAERLSERLPGRVAALSCSSARRGNDSIDYQRLIRGNAERRLLSVYYASSLDRRDVEASTLSVLCADHVGYDRPRLVYREDSSGLLELKDLSEFVKVIKDAFFAFFRDYSAADFSPDSDLVNAVGSLIYELFSNTHSHARTEHDGSDIAVSARGFYLKIINVETGSLRDASGGYAPLEQYLLRLPEQKQRYRRFVELSVFDSGPGFASRLARTPAESLSSAQELALVERCFVSGVTSKGHRRYGEGLPHVVSLLRARLGFIRVRTGRACLYKDFGRERGWGREVPPTFEYGSGPRGQLNPTAKGTTLTLVVPVLRSVP
jgi:hypothetical protein